MTSYNFELLSFKNGAREIVRFFFASMPTNRVAMARPFAHSLQPQFVTAASVSSADSCERVILQRVAAYRECTRKSYKRRSPRRICLYSESPAIVPSHRYTHSYSKPRCGWSRPSASCCCCRSTQVTQQLALFYRPTS